MKSKVKVDGLHTKERSEYLLNESIVLLSELSEEELKDYSKWIMLANTVAPMFNTTVEEAFGFGEDVNDEQMIVFALWFYEKKGKAGKRERRKKK